jgi:hypothetical protein
VIQVSDWARDLLLSRGALVESEAESEGQGVVRALLPPEVSTKLAVSDWLSLDFRAHRGADDPGEWIDRLSTLLPPSPAIAGGRMRMRTPPGRIDAEAILHRDLTIQNGIWRLVEDYAGAMAYYFFSFQYTVESDERTIGYASVCVNGVARSIAEQPESLIRSVRDALEDDPAFVTPAEDLRALYPLAARVAREEAAARVAFIEQSANRRLARDYERMESYYSGMLAQVEKRAARRVADPQAAEKERARIAALRLDHAAKLKDLIRKYSLRVQFELTDVLIVSLPVHAISVKLLRKKEERPVTLAWNALLRRLDTPVCESCTGRARPLHLCDKASGTLHVLCAACWRACPRCARLSCRACTPKCKCGAATMGNNIPVAGQSGGGTTLGTTPTTSQ